MGALASAESRVTISLGDRRSGRACRASQAAVLVA